MQIITITGDLARRKAVQAIQSVQEGYVVRIGPATRNLDQNSKFHALCHDLEKSGLEWAGKPRSLAQWKSLLISAHAVATNEGAEIVPGLENEFVNIRESSARMSKARASSLIEYTVAFCAEKGVRLSAIEC